MTELGDRIIALLNEQPDISARHAAELCGCSLETIALYRYRGGPNGDLPVHPKAPGNNRKAFQERVKLAREHLLRDALQTDLTISHLAQCGLEAVAKTRKAMEEEGLIPRTDSSMRQKKMREGRRQQAVKLISEGQTPRQVAKEMKWTESYIRKLARDAGMEIPDDGFDVNRFVDATITQVWGYLQGVEDIDHRWDDIDVSHLESWLSAISTAQEKLRWLKKNLKAVSQAKESP